MNKRDRVCLLHIRDSISAIKEYTAIGRQAFLNSRLHRDAVIRNFEIIGEASNRLSAAFRAETGIAWAELKAFRNFLIHQYDAVDTALVWKIVVDDLPELERHIQRLLSE